jgi:parallel beta-helix repeat protein
MAECIDDCHHASRTEILRESVYITAVVLSLLLLSSFGQTGPMTSQMSRDVINEQPTRQTTTAAYTPHGPIVITTDDDFLSQGWKGDGTKETPFLIQDLNITTTGVCIDISNTNVFFVIRDCLLNSSVYSGSYAAVSFDNLEYGKVTHCILGNHHTGLFLSQTSHCNASVNTMTNCVRGFEVYDSDTCTFNDNTLIGSAYGFFVRSSTSCMFVHNSAIDPTANGYDIADSYGCTFANNTATSSNYYYYGFETANSVLCT